MANIAYIETANGITMYLNGAPVRIGSEDVRYSKLIETLADPNSTNDDIAEIVSIVDTKAYAISKLIKEVDDIGDLRFESCTDPGTGVSRYTVTYKTRELPETLVNKLTTLWVNGVKNFDHFGMFLDNIMANPSERAREELYTFLSETEMPITQNGTFIAYKGLRSDMYSISGNTKTRVLKGTVNKEGHILNQPGEVIQVVTADVDADCNNYCSCGLHVGSYRYASDFSNSGPVVAVEVNPKDVVSVPTDCGCEKCRVSMYKVLNIVAGSYKASAAEIDEDTSTVTATAGSDSLDSTTVIGSKLDINKLISTRGAELTKLISTYITNKGGTATIRQISKRLGKNVPGITVGSCKTMLLRLGFNIDAHNSQNVGNYTVEC